MEILTHLIAFSFGFMCCSSALYAATRKKETVKPSTRKRAKTGTRKKRATVPFNDKVDLFD